MVSLMRKDETCSLSYWVMSDPVQLIVGPDSLRYVIHEKLLNGLSGRMENEVLSAKSANGIKTLHWPEVEPFTAASVLEFAYLGDFESPRFYLMNPYKMTALNHFAPDFRFPAVLAAAWKRFVLASRSYDENEILWEVDDLSDDPDALSTLGRVYRFANKYEIRNLERLCLNKLHRLMVKNQVENDMVDFLEDCAKDGCPADLFDLAVQYATLKAKFFKYDEDFKKVLRDNANLATAVFWCHSEILCLHNTN